MDKSSVLFIEGARIGVQNLADELGLARYKMSS